MGGHRRHGGVAIKRNRGAKAAHERGALAKMSVLILTLPLAASQSSWVGYSLVGDGCCRQLAGGTYVEGSLRRYFGVHSLANCSAACDRDVHCAGFEFSSLNSVCELHVAPPVAVNDNVACACYRRLSANESFATDDGNVLAGEGDTCNEHLECDEALFCSAGHTCTSCVSCSQASSVDNVCPPRCQATSTTTTQSAGSQTYAACTDTVIDGEPWRDAFNASCSDYARTDNCHFGHTLHRGYSALTACCACGGGSLYTTHSWTSTTATTRTSTSGTVPRCNGVLDDPLCYDHRDLGNCDVPRVRRACPALCRACHAPSLPPTSTLSPSAIESSTAPGVSLSTSPAILTNSPSGAPTSTAPATQTFDAPTSAPTDTDRPSHAPTSAPTSSPSAELHQCNGVFEPASCYDRPCSGIFSSSMIDLCPYACGLCQAPTGAPTTMPTDVPTTGAPTTPVPTATPTLAPTSAVPSSVTPTSAPVSPSPSTQSPTSFAPSSAPSDLPTPSILVTSGACNRLRLNRTSGDVLCAESAIMCAAYISEHTFGTATSCAELCARSGLTCSRSHSNGPRSSNRCRHYAQGTEARSCNEPSSNGDDVCVCDGVMPASAPQGISETPLPRLGFDIDDTDDDAVANNVRPTAANLEGNCCRTSTGQSLCSGQIHSTQEPCQTCICHQQNLICAPTC